MKLFTNYGRLSGDMSKKDEAMDYYQKALKIARDIKDLEYEGSIMANFGAHYLLKKKPGKQSYFMLSTVFGDK